MPVRHLPLPPDFYGLHKQVESLLQGHATRNLAAAQRIREFHPRFLASTDPEIFQASQSLADGQLTIAREYGFASWTRLMQLVEEPVLLSRLNLPHHERIDDAIFRRAVDLLDTGNAPGLRTLLEQHPSLAKQHVVFEGGNYFRNPTLLGFVAENPVRHGTLPANIVEVARVILDAGAGQSARDETLGLVATGRVPRECRVQIPLIDLLCEDGADPNAAIHPAALHGEHEALSSLIRHGARIDLPVAAALGRTAEMKQLLPLADQEDRHLALALGSQFGHVEIVRALLDAGEDPDRYNPAGGHSHSTPLHQAAFAGHGELVRLFLERGARVDMEDLLWQGTPADWAGHAGQMDIERVLRA